MTPSITEDVMEERLREVQKQEDELRAQLTQTHKEQRAIRLYLQAMREQPPEDGREAAPERPKTRARPGEQRGRLLAFLQERPEGLTWAELKDLTGVTPGQEESRLYHGLQNMRRSNLVELTDEKRYTLRREAASMPKPREAA